MNPVSKLKITAIVQARMGSKRLPGKVLREVLPGKTLISLLISRIKKSKMIDQIVVATSNSKDDDGVEAEAIKNDVQCHRGSGHEDDVLTRFVEAARNYDAQNLVRLCADSPLHDANIVDKCIEEYVNRYREIDFVTNCLPETFPYGTAVEILPIDMLLRLDRLSTEASQREHVTQYFYQNTSLFRYYCVLNEKDYSKKRWVVDTPEDFEFVKSVYLKLGPDKITTDWRDILQMSNS